MSTYSRPTCIVVHIEDDAPVCTSTYYQDEEPEKVDITFRVSLWTDKEPPEYIEL